MQYVIFFSGECVLCTVTGNPNGSCSKVGLIVIAANFRWNGKWTVTHIFAVLTISTQFCVHFVYYFKPIPLYIYKCIHTCKQKRLLKAKTKDSVRRIEAKYSASLILYICKHKQISSITYSNWIIYGFCYLLSIAIVRFLFLFCSLRLLLLLCCCC